MSARGIHAFITYGRGQAVKHMIKRARSVAESQHSLTQSLEKLTTSFKDLGKLESTFLDRTKV